MDAILSQMLVVILLLTVVLIAVATYRTVYAEMTQDSSVSAENASDSKRESKHIRARYAGINTVCLKTEEGKKNDGNY